MKIWLIRHGATPGNAQKRYIGTTDEPLSELGIRQARSFCAPEINALIVSPLLRCVQTVEIIFPGKSYSTCDDLRECDFGVFEGRNADEMVDDSEYSAWVDSCCVDPIPGGETVEHFRRRCTEAFESIVRTFSEGDSLAFTIHGGSIMAVLERFEGRRGFYEYHIANCDYVLCDCTVGEEITMEIIGGALC